MNGATATSLGAVIGLMAGLGVFILLTQNPRMRRPDLAARIDPYVRTDRSRKRRGEVTSVGWRLVLERLAGPVAVRGLGILERLTGGEQQLERRLRLAGRADAADAFRLEQVALGALGGALGLLVGVAAVLRGTTPLIGLALVVLGAACGVVLRDHLLTRSIERRAQRMSREFPTVADLLALAVSAGESPVAALERVARTSRGALPEEFATTVAQIRAGAPVAQALLDLGERTPLEAIGRFSEGVAVAIERGTPLSEVLRAQAQDAREASKRDLLEIAGRREVAMLVPVVFFVLPLVIVFAIFPGLAVLRLTV